MRVYVCYECYCDFNDDIFKTVVKVVNDEVKALMWKDEFIDTDTEWRSYSEMTVE